MTDKRWRRPRRRDEAGAPRQSERDGVLGLIGIAPDPSPNDRTSVHQAGLQIVIIQPPGIAAGPPRIIGPEPVRQIEHEPAQNGR